MKYFQYIGILLFLISCKTLKTSQGSHLQENYSYDIESRLDSLGILLHTPTAPKANYVTAVQSGNLIYLSGHGPKKQDGTYVTGKVGEKLSTEEAYNAARLTGIALLSSLKALIGDLNKVVKIVKVGGMVNCNPDYTDHPKVINGFSDLMVQVFGERGKHARSAVGMSSLPWDFACEIEMIVEIQP